MIHFGNIFLMLTWWFENGHSPHYFLGNFVLLLYCCAAANVDHWNCVYLYWWLSAHDVLLVNYIPFHCFPFGLYVLTVCKINCPLGQINSHIHLDFFILYLFYVTGVLIYWVHIKVGTDDMREQYVQGVWVDGTYLTMIIKYACTSDYWHDNRNITR